MHKKIPILFSFFLCYSMTAQVYTDYIGAGHNTGITVTSSGNYLNSVAANTINGSGLDAKKMEASRFLRQSTLGYESNDVDAVVNDGFESWIDNQFNIPAVSYQDTMQKIWDYKYQILIDSGVPEPDIYGPSALEFNYSWYTNAIFGDDLLRQKIAFALSQITVISYDSDLYDSALALTNYYDMLMANSFGNYKDLLLDVTHHPAMGYYLSHLNNEKEDPISGTTPDQNYAREIMQLFSIGLYELNNDGTRKKDNSGNDIPTYDNDDIRELAKIFTGLGAGAVTEYGQMYYPVPQFGINIGLIDPTVPMNMYDNYHEPGQKIILKSLTIPPGLTGEQDIELAVDYLFKHDNVGPFVARRLIQHMVKSNPTPAYIDRVATVFNNDGNGVRGDMKAVVKAILLDEEARECYYLEQPDQGRMLSPVERIVHIGKMMDLELPDHGYFMPNGFDVLEELDQGPLGSKTVFNFYLPDYVPVGDFDNNDLYGPEYQIYNSRTSINWFNFVHWMQWGNFSYGWEGYIDTFVAMDFANYSPLAEEPEELLNEFDVLFTNGQITEELRAQLRIACEGLIWGDYQRDRTRMLFNLIAISPDFTILK